MRTTSEAILRLSCVTLNDGDSPTEMRTFGGVDDKQRFDHSVRWEYYTTDVNEKDTYLKHVPF